MLTFFKVLGLFLDCIMVGLGVVAIVSGHWLLGLTAIGFVVLINVIFAKLTP